ncbi:embryonic polarity protein dorsal-like isoform X4 [Malaya genurostris]|uniref:embryonic polarity protein dorsal-like isoform X4 n=1 Tax=Malaya genurostris TaxID=325434 RepID=UPI0026F3C1FC|nr:embryonic polarity protein dorsal-like isoform X4 [Malaya genurostris]
MSFPTRSTASFSRSIIRRKVRHNSSASSSSSTSSSDYEHLNLFHKLENLKKSPLAGMYNSIVHRVHARAVPEPPGTPKIVVTQEPKPNPKADIIVEEMPPTAPEKPFVVITEQPQSKALRFRYECEGRSAGSIPGVHSTPEQKTFPSIEVRGYKGRAVVVVSCVTKDPPYRPHPHNLVGKEGCKKGVCTVEINSSSMTYTFSNLGIQCVKKKDIEDALRLREEIRVDPFKTGYSHAKQPATIDLNAVRLCFQVFLEGQQRGRFTEPLQPVVSDIIYDKKAMSDLVICKLSDITASVAGGKEIILLCEKVAKEDISVRFYEEQHGKIVWEDIGEFQHTNVHKQVAICFRTPRYRTLEVEHSVMVNIQLRRPSDGATSEPLPFELVPLDSANLSQKRKRRNWEVPEHTPEVARGAYYGHMLNVPGEAIKTEPRDSPTHQFLGFQGTYRNPNETPSPVERSPIGHHGNTTPVGPTSPFTGGASGLTPTAGGYQVSTANDFFLGTQQPQQQQQQQQQQPQQQQFQNQYNFVSTSPANGLAMYPQQQQQQQPSQNHQFQIPTNISNVQQFNVANLVNGGLPVTLTQAGPSGIAAGTSGGSVCQQTTTGNTAEYNLSSLLDMDLGKEFTMNSSEIKSIMGHFSNSDIKQELQNHNNNNNNNQHHPHRMQQEEENLSNSFTRLTTSTLNDLDK